MTAPDADVAVVGVGTAGSMALWQLAAAGVGAVGFEAHAPGHDGGAAGGETRLYRMAYAEGGRWLAPLRRALDGWRQLERETGAALLTQCGGLSIGHPGEDYVRSVLAMAAEHGVPVELLDRPEAAQRFPQHALLPGEVAVLDPQAGVLRSDAAVIAAAARAEALGAKVLRHCPVEDIEPHADHVALVAAGRTWRFRDVVLCAGSWSGRFLPSGLGARVRPQRVLLSWFAARDPAAFAPDRFPVFVRESDGVHLYGTPSVDGVTVKVAGAAVSHVVDDPSAVARRHSPGEVRHMADAVGRFLPDLHPDPVRVDAFTDLYADDGVPLLGRVPGAERLIAATAFSGRGFKLAPTIGAEVANLVRGTPSPDLAFCAP
ncbi:N-methyl-L-tryptophan oxidase [Actinomycetes bacterium KLBMP 9759]